MKTWRMRIAITVVAISTLGACLDFGSLGGGDDSCGSNCAQGSDASADGTITGSDGSSPGDAGQTCMGAPAAWTSVNPGPLQVRDQAAVFWTGTDFLVYGGTIWGLPAQPGDVNDGGLGCALANELDACNDGARYNPTTNAWTRISSVNAPNPYRWDSGFGFGAGKLLQFGGNAANNIGGLYDLDTDSWKVISTVGAPEARAYHAVYYYPGPTGPDFMVWGGLGALADGGYGALDDGALYDVNTDAWVAMRSDGAPPGGAYYATASSATQLFVWGGSIAQAPYNPSVDPSTMLGTGAVFTYLNNGWIPMSTTSAPSPRRFARGVWTGSKFIVWGGSAANGNVGYNDGGMYDPTTDTWTPMSTANAPPAGNPSVMVWTGKRVLVWGIFN
ncbi:MAG: Kelch repeat-containing protein, partial [Polyangiaceae bacterium]